MTETIVIIKKIKNNNNNMLKIVNNLKIAYKLNNLLGQTRQNRFISNNNTRLNASQLPNADIKSNLNIIP